MTKTVYNHKPYSWILSSSLLFRSIKEWNTTNTSCPELVICRIDDIGTTQAFVTGFFPFCYQRSVYQLLIDAIIIYFSGNPFVCVEEIVYVSRLLPIDLMNRPQGLSFAFAFVGFLYLVTKLIFQCVQNRFHIIKAWWYLFLFAPTWRHGASPSDRRQLQSRRPIQRNVCLQPVPVRQASTEEVVLTTSTDYGKLTRTALPPVPVPVPVLVPPCRTPLYIYLKSECSTVPYNKTVLVLTSHDHQ